MLKLLLALSFVSITQSTYNIECFVGAVTPGVVNGQLAVSTLCSNCDYCLKLSGTLGGAPWTYRGCGCLNQQYPYTCSSRQTQNSVSAVPGFAGSAYCCTGNRCNSSFSTSTLTSLTLLCALFSLFS